MGFRAVPNAWGGENAGRPRTGWGRGHVGEGPRGGGATEAERVAGGLPGTPAPSGGARGAAGPAELACPPTATFAHTHIYCRRRSRDGDAASESPQSFFWVSSAARGWSGRVPGVSRPVGRTRGGPSFHPCPAAGPGVRAAPARRLRRTC